MALWGCQQCERCAVLSYDITANVSYVSERLQLDDVLHRVNNLLSTIEIQSEVARTLGTSEALTQALDLIVDSAQRTRDELRSIRED